MQQTTKLQLYPYDKLIGNCPLPNASDDSPINVLEVSLCLSKRFTLSRAIPRSTLLPSPR